MRGETESGKEKVRRAPCTLQHFYRAFLWSRLRDLSWLNIFPSHLIQLWWTEFSLENVYGCMTMGWLWGNPSRPPTVTTVFSKEMEFGGNVVIGTFWWPLKCFIPNNGFSVSVLYLNMDIFAQPQRGQSVSTTGIVTQSVSQEGVDDSTDASKIVSFRAILQKSTILLIFRNIHRGQCWL